MGPPSCMRSVVDRNVVMRRMTVLSSIHEYIENRRREGRTFVFGWLKLFYAGAVESCDISGGKKRERLTAASQVRHI